MTTVDEALDRALGSAKAAREVALDPALMWALARRAGRDARDPDDDFDPNPGLAELPLAAATTLLARGLVCPTREVADGAWWALASLEHAGPSPKKWLAKLVNKPAAYGFDAALIERADRQPFALYKAWMASPPERSPSVQLAAIVAENTKERRAKPGVVGLPSESSELLFRYVPAGWILARATSLGAAISPHATQALDGSAPHPEAFARRLVEHLEHAPHHGAEHTLMALARKTPLPESLAARVQALADQRVGFAPIYARIVGTAAAEDYLLYALEALPDDKLGRWSFSLKLLMERPALTEDARVALLATAVATTACAPSVVAHYAKTIEVDKLTEPGRTAWRALATCGVPQVADGET